jgi:hypothetical protein
MLRRCDSKFEKIAETSEASRATLSEIGLIARAA